MSGNFQLVLLGLVLIAAYGSTKILSDEAVENQLELLESKKAVTGNPRICRGHAWNHHNQHTGDYLRPHSDCRKFWSCTAAGTPYQMNCPSGLHFDNKHKICNWPELAGCSGHGGGGGGDCDCSSDSCDDSCDCPPKTTEKPDCDCSSDSCDDSCDCPPKTTEKPDCDCSSDSCDDSCECPPDTTEAPEPTTEEPCDCDSSSGDCSSSSSSSSSSESREAGDAKRIEVLL